MFLGLIAAVFFHITYVRGAECPIIEQIKPCECKFDNPGFVVSCNGNQVDEIREVLANINHTDVDIRNINLTHVWLPNLPANFLLGPNIRFITIDNCFLSSVDKDAFADMKSTLIDLVLSNNDLERVPSNALEKLSRLKAVVLDGNRIERVDAGAFKGPDSLLLVSLRANKIKFIDNLAFLGVGRRFFFLDLGNNELTTAPCLALRNLSSLQFLELDNNKIAALDPKEFNAMGGGSLVRLNLTNNRIRNLPAGAFATMEALSNLSLSGNSIESIHPSAFQGIEDTLNFLDLPDNQLQEVPSAALRDMNVLLVLNLMNNNICKIRKDDFLSFGKSLIIIDLDNNSLACLDPESLIPLKSLEYLWMSSNQLKTVTYETISPVFGTLQILGIADNPLHCDCSLSWYRDWMERQPTRKTEARCATPELHANYPAYYMSSFLTCVNETSNPVEPSCSCENDTQHQSSDAFMPGCSRTIIIFAHLLITVLLLQQDGCLDGSLFGCPIIIEPKWN